MAFRRRTSDTLRDGEPGGSADLARLVVDEITWYMREHKVSRAQLAQTMNVSPGRISQILSGDENLTLRTLSGVLAALRAEVDFALRPPEEPAGVFERQGGYGDVDDDQDTDAFSPRG